MGWLGEPDQPGRQGLIEKSEPDLLELVKKRIKRPEPRDSESQPLDSLYAKYVRNPPLAFSFAHPGSPLTAIVDQEPSQRVSHLKVERDDTRNDPLLLPLDGQSHEGLFIAGDPCVPALFTRAWANGPPRLYPVGQLLQTEPTGGHALGVDVGARRAGPRPDRRPADYRLFEGMLLGLPFIRHGPQVNYEWAEFGPLVGELLGALKTGPGAMSPDRGLVSNVRRLHAQMDKAIQNLAEGLDGMEPWQKPNRLKTPVRDLRSYLLNSPIYGRRKPSSIFGSIWDPAWSYPATR